MANVTYAAGVLTPEELNSGAWHKWWCDGQHPNGPREYQGDVCGVAKEAIAMMISAEATDADLSAAAALLGYHPTHKVDGVAPRTMPFCDACATNLTSPLAMEPCPKTGLLQTWDVVGTTRNWRVEKRIDTKNGGTYLYCPCPAWKFGGQDCKHTTIVAGGGW